MAKSGTIHLRDDNFLKEVGKKVFEFRKVLGLTQGELADRCFELVGKKKDADYTQIARIEKGQVNFSVSYLKIIADALEVHPSELLP